MSDDETPPTPADAKRAMTPLEPYVASEVGDLLGVPGRVARRLLNALYDEGAVEKKPVADGPAIWVRHAPQYACAACGREFEVRFLHPVLGQARYCPRCGERVEDE